jgi:hypothetical protein
VSGGCTVILTTPLRNTEVARKPRNQETARRSDRFPFPIAYASVAMTGSIAAAGSLENEPCASFGFIDEIREYTYTRHVSVLIAHAVCFAHFAGTLFIVVVGRRQHIVRRNEVRVIVPDALQASDLAD